MEKHIIQKMKMIVKNETRPYPKTSRQTRKTLNLTTGISFGDIPRKGRI